MTELKPCYIKMFDHPKIQGEWKPEVGDRYFDGGIFYVQDVEDFANEYNYKFSDLIFLPTIEQMAEMFWVDPENDADYFMWVSLFNTWCAENYKELRPKKYPLEILVLMFLMYDLHGLRWSEKKGWV